MRKKDEPDWILTAREEEPIRGKVMITRGSCCHLLLQNSEFRCAGYIIITAFIQWFLFRYKNCHAFVTVPMRMRKVIRSEVLGPFRPRTFLHKLLVCDTLGTNYPPEFELNSHSPWEESMKRMAAEALFPVFYPSNHVISAPGTGTGDDNNLKNMQSKNTLDPEKALKKLLRRYQKDLSSQTTTVKQRQASRKLMADLVLGTSIMRLRHYHTLIAVLESNQIESKAYGISLKDVEPIVDLWESYHCCEANEVERMDCRMKIVRAMVDIHSEYMTASDRIKAECNRDDTPTPIQADSLLLLEYTNSKNPAERISILQSLPIFFVELLIEQYGEEITEQMAIVFNEPGPITIRQNRIKSPSVELLCKRLLKEHSITAIPGNIPGLLIGEKQVSSISPKGCIRLLVDDSWSPSKTSIWSLHAWKDGWFEVQDAGSQVIVEATEATSGDTVVDFCAGNGGKTFALASQMYDKKVGSKIVAHDIVEERLRQLKGSFGRIGLASSSDSVSALSNVTVATTSDAGISLKERMADVVLVDAPCSSTGVLRRRPSQRFKLDKNEIVNEFPSLQLSILKKGAKLVKNGGRLLYATCSITHYENEDVVKAFESSDEFAHDWERWNFDDESETSCELRHCRALLPTMDGSDGFFMARWRRKVQVMKS